MIDLTPEIHPAEPKTLARLAEFTSESPVISLFVDLGPNFLTPPARQSEINSLLTLAHSELENIKEGTSKYESALDSLKTYLEENDEWVKEARGAAIYLSTDGERFEIVKSLEPLERKAVISDWPHIEPLVDVVSGEIWCVMLINRTVARYLVGIPNRLRELTSIEDEVHGQHSQGGWSQARYQRSVEEEVQDHIKSSCERLREIFRRRFDCLVVVTLHEMWPEVEKELHADLKKQLVGTLEFDIENTSVDEVENEVGQLAEVRSNQQEKELIGTLREALGRGERAAAGVEAVLAAVTENKVDTLLVDEGFEATGVACSSCGWSGLKGKTCPVDSKPLRQDIDLKDWATRRTLAASGQVRVVKFHPDLQGHGGIAALLRY
jgi:peptide chain release factor subunit 1